MRDVVIAGNWKMNKTLDEAKRFLNELNNDELNRTNCKKMIFVSSVNLFAMVRLAKDLDIVVGAQNMHEEEKGAYTGEISADMLLSIGIKDVLIGHSERRQYYNETDQVVNKKLKLALEKKMNPILCIGEVLSERESNMTNVVLKEQVVNAFKDIDGASLDNVIIAYEPVWAIGTGKTATAEDANKACAFVRSVVEELYGGELANEMVIQYGGSVNPENVEELLGQSDIDGALVGGASLNVESFKGLLR